VCVCVCVCGLFKYLRLSGNEKFIFFLEVGKVENSFLSKPTNDKVFLMNACSSSQSYKRILVLNKTKLVLNTLI